MPLVSAIAVRPENRHLLSLWSVFGNDTKPGRRGASPNGARPVECRGAVIPSPEGATGAAVGPGERHAVPIDRVQA